MSSCDVLLSLGANIDNPKKNLDDCIDILKNTHGIIVKSVSGFYVTSPLDYINQPDFINCAVLCSTDIDVYEFHSITKNIENKIGKNKTIKDGPRKIDIDIIFFGDKVINDEKIILPHSKMHFRRFVLVPAAEICPDFIHPVMRMTVKKLLEKLPIDDSQKVELCSKY